MTTPANNPAKVSQPKLKASIDSRSLPIELFGSGRSRHQRKLVYNYLATWANPDGTSAYPSLNRIAKENGFTRRGVIFIIQWLSEHCLLKIAKERSSRNTNDYTVLFSEEDQERCRPAIKKDAKEQKLSGRRDKAHRGRVLGGKRAAEKRWGNGSDSQQSPPNLVSGDSQQSPTPSDCNNHQSGDSRAKMVINELPNGDSQRLHDRPSLPSLDRPSPSTTSKTVGADGACSSDQNETLGQENTENELVREAFLQQQAKLLHEAHLSRTILDHTNQSWATAQKTGIEIYLCALRLWLRHDSAEDLIISRTQNELTGKWTTKKRTWPLKTFLDSTSLPAYVSKARPFHELGATGDLLDFLTKTDPQELPEQFTQDHLDKVRLAIAEHGIGYCEAALDNSLSGDDFFNDPVGVTRQQRQAWADKYGPPDLKTNGAAT